MKLLDLFRMSSSNLWKRKVRTILTVLGVMIGTASIVVMISLGLGLNRSTLKEIEENGGLTTIYVSENFSYGEEDIEEDDANKLNDALVEILSQIPHVKVVSPVLELPIILKQGTYECYANLQGMNIDALKSMGIPLAQGRLPIKGGTDVEMVFGNQIPTEFYNARTGEGYWETGEVPDVDLMNEDFFVIYDVDAYYEAKDSTEPGVRQPKKYLLRGCGLVAGGTEDYNNFSSGVYCDIDVLMNQLKRIYRGKPIPGQPTTSSGKAYKDIYYTYIYVNVDHMNHVSEVQKIISDMGYQADSNIEWVESMQKEYSYIQAVLGGIGAISLLVAAIGITNTMMMSIYERTKEIGIMKVLGCDLRNIRSLFLMEAGYIGFIGGITGVILSYMISGIVNVVVAHMGTDMVLSYIPIWLALISIGFAVLVGIAAGYFPSKRAMKLSPLAAIRNE